MTKFAKLQSEKNALELVLAAKAEEVEELSVELEGVYTDLAEADFTIAELREELDETVAYAEEADELIDEARGELFVTELQLYAASYMLEMAMPKLDALMRKEKRAEQLQREEAEARAMPELTNWALATNLPRMSVDGLAVTFSHDRWSRRSVTNTDYYADGKERQSVKTTTAKGTVVIRLPLLGAVKVPAEVKQVETWDHEPMSRHYISNELRFSVKIEGVKRDVVVTSNGEICFCSIGVCGKIRRVSALAEQFCYGCDVTHTEQVDVKIG